MYPFPFLWVYFPWLIYRSSCIVKIKTLGLWYSLQLLFPSSLFLFKCYLNLKLYTTDKLLNTASETNNVLYVSQSNLNKKITIIKLYVESISFWGEKNLSPFQDCKNIHPCFYTVHVWLFLYLNIWRIYMLMARSKMKIQLNCFLTSHYIIIYYKIHVFSQ